MQSTITIEGRVFGQKRPLFTDWSLPLPPEFTHDGERITLRALLTRIVHAEVDAFRERQEQRRMVQTLTQADIARGLMRGKVDAAGREMAQQVDAETAVAAALLGYEDGLYYVFVDDEQQLDLDREVYLRSDSKITFLRLVALAGG
jgi:hypothetical protein